ncbi:hypothetical protein [Sphingomonas oryzagri]|jgi:hypothetical protein|uniref:Uncharacterized protein n=1 Tax=Sphingomonas oryzagri TaxID=3042314 RepID=A0ABT6N6S1_9SPHN|nr:hypothetical protein [Sphingomonas oryzagri]MDH7640813.1 hypothetical protein [Sphingomonas oryzagri]
MRLSNLVAGAAAIMIISGSAGAAVRPAVGVASLQPTQMAGSRIGAPASGARAHLAGGGAGLAIVGVAAVGIGVAVADAAGAFKDDDHHLNPVSP